MRALKQQVSMLASKARALYESRQQIELENLLSTVAPTAAILLNLEISLTNDQIHEEGSTLARTLLPYLNRVTDYAFLVPDTIFIMTRFLNSLIRHICDTKSRVGDGFMLFALKINPHVVKDIINFNGNVAALSSALSYYGYPIEAAQVMACHPRKFLWLELMQFWKGKNKDVVNECTLVLSRMDVLSDPGQLMNRLLDIFSQRRLMLDLLLQSPTIDLSLQKLLLILQKLAPMQSATITACLS